MMNNLKIAFFGTSRFSVLALENLKNKGVTPSLIVTGEDKPKGRNLVITPPPAKIYAQENNIPFLQPQKLNDPIFLEELKKTNWDLFIVASYGKIIPKEIIDLPIHKTLNIHPSLLPRLRGSSPIQSSILTEDKTGVTIIMLDEEMDHGPIVAQKEVSILDWPPKALELEEILAAEGSDLLADIIPLWISKEITPKEQDHNKATFTKKIQKSDGLIDLSEDPIKNYKKIQAYTPWPSAYFFTKHKGKDMRVIIKDAKLIEGKLEITKVLPEGRKEISYSDFVKNLQN